MATLAVGMATGGGPSDAGRKKPFKKDPDDNSSPGRKLSTKACDNCRKRRVRCDEQLPCGPCQERREDCSYDDPEKKRGPKAGWTNSRSAIQTLADLIPGLGDALVALFHTMEVDDTGMTIMQYASNLENRLAVGGRLEGTLFGMFGYEDFGSDEPGVLARINDPRILRYRDALRHFLEILRADSVTAGNAGATLPTPLTVRPFALSSHDPESRQGPETRQTTRTRRASRARQGTDGSEVTPARPIAPAPSSTQAPVAMEAHSVVQNSLSAHATQGFGSHVNTQLMQTPQGHQAPQSHLAPQALQTPQAAHVSFGSEFSQAIPDAQFFQASQLNPQAMGWSPTMPTLDFGHFTADPRLMQQPHDLMQQDYPYMQNNLMYQGLQQQTMIQQTMNLQDFYQHHGLPAIPSRSQTPTEMSAPSESGSEAGPGRFEIDTTGVDMTYTLSDEVIMGQDFPNQSQQGTQDGQGSQFSQAYRAFRW
ncbi:uncharacterized protein B0I36DRAFT_354518 [Microdochium trichocladiopsis]|uniref:Zn(2)-C6 fungal-type domain-containing protein n=1 Tax=Microdochium trichocladiopsis TaxID=1682393 RepID=A0A9P8XVQ6_9PEZI|nr:uncharacterized protein B0I36DRAFT_354518 [Microdochium trichocladiopsis]KAH7018216.1 hypothetical protein B0I36DRAFT_354518 [Microdochium trichocladiopsis]